MRSVLRSTLLASVVIATAMLAPSPQAPVEPLSPAEMSAPSLTASDTATITQPFAGAILVQDAPDWAPGAPQPDVAKGLAIASLAVHAPNPPTLTRSTVTDVNPNAGVRQSTMPRDTMTPHALVHRSRIARPSARTTL